MALPKVHRLRHRWEFSQVYRSGIRLSTHHLVLRALQLPSTSTSSSVALSQIGVSISQKVSKRAVIRNRIKRQIQSVIQQLLPRLSPGWQIVIVVRPSATQCDYSQFLQELEQLLTEARIINGY